MAISDQIGSAASTTELVGTVDLLIGVAGPANAEELRCRAERAFPSLIASGVLRIAVASPMASPAEAASTLAPSDSGLQFLNYPLSCLGCAFAAVARGSGRLSRDCSSCGKQGRASLRDSGPGSWRARRYDR